jgi:hypothetical protein
MAQLIASLALPALAILAAAAVQIVIGPWFSQRGPSASPVSANTYVALAVLGVLCLLVGIWVRKHAITRGSMLGVWLVPVAWCAVMSWAAFHVTGPSAWLRPLTAIVMLAGLTPLFGIAAGWAIAAREPVRPLASIEDAVKAVDAVCARGDSEFVLQVSDGLRDAAGLNMVTIYNRILSHGTWMPDGVEQRSGFRLYRYRRSPS